MALDDDPLERRQQWNDRQLRLGLAWQSVDVRVIEAERMQLLFVRPLVDLRFGQRLFRFEILLLGRDLGAPEPALAFEVCACQGQPFEGGQVARLGFGQFATLHQRQPFARPHRIAERLVDPDDDSWYPRCHVGEPVAVEGNLSRKIDEHVQCSGFGGAYANAELPQLFGGELDSFGVAFVLVTMTAGPFRRRSACLPGCLLVVRVVRVVIIVLRRLTAIAG